MIHPRTRKRDGRRVYDVRLRDPAGKVYTRTFETKKAAEVFETAEKSARHRGAWIDPRLSNLTFGDVATRWLASNPAKRPSALARDESIVRVHLVPRFGNATLAAVTQPDIQALVTAWSARSAPRTVRRQYGTLRAVFAYAVNADLIARSPCRKINLPAVDALNRRLPGPDELADLADALGVYAPMMWLGVLLGLRWGEAAGLRVGRVDLLRSEVTVDEQLTRGKGGMSGSGPPKSDAGRRTLTIPAPLVDVLAAHLASRGLTGRDVDTLLFVSPECRPLDYSHWRRRVWLPTCQAAGMAGLGFHDLRRANATGMVADGVDLKTAQTRLGHSDPRLTLAVYAQATAAGDRAAAEGLAARYMPGPRDGRATVRRVGGGPAAPASA
ncbi:MAG: site-specific integrase [Actinomycetota bacterium]|nr:site-specific integrase [Actinomycetota bacterium]